MAAQPEEDARDAAISAGAVDEDDAFTGPILPSTDGVPGQAVFFHEAGGFVPDPHHDGTDYRRSVVLVTVRSAAEDREGGRLLTQDLFDALHKAEIAGYVDVLAQRDRFSWVGQDEVGHHIWTCDFLMTHVA